MKKDDKYVMRWLCNRCGKDYISERGAAMESCQPERLRPVKRSDYWYTRLLDQIGRQPGARNNHFSMDYLLGRYDEAVYQEQCCR